MPTLRVDGSGIRAYAVGMRVRFVAIVCAALLGAVLLAGGTPAGAVDNPDYTSPPPTTVVTTPTSAQPAQKVQTAVVVRPVRSRLAITGADVGQSAEIGGALVLVGAGLLVIRRRRPSGV